METFKSHAQLLNNDMIMSHDTCHMIHMAKSYINNIRVIQQSHDIPEGHNDEEENPKC